MPASRRSTAQDEDAAGLSAAEREAVRERSREARAARKGTGAAEGEAAIQEKLAALEGAERDLVSRMHALVRAAAPHLVPRTWYGMPAYSREGKVVCWLKPASKFGSRYATVGFSDVAALDDGPMWPTEYAVTVLDSGVEQRLDELVRRAAGEPTGTAG